MPHYFSSTPQQAAAFQMMNANQQSSPIMSSPNNTFMRQSFMNVVNQSTMNQSMNQLPQLYKQQINMHQQQQQTQHILNHQIINQRPNYLQQQYFAQSVQSTPKFFNSTSAPLLTCNNTPTQFLDQNSQFTNSLVLSPEDEELLSHLHDSELMMSSNNNTQLAQVVEHQPQQQQSAPVFAVTNSSPINDDNLSDFVTDDNSNNSNNWKVTWSDANREREWQLGDFPQFKACKKRKEFFTAQFENIWYKIPYKYHMLMKVKSFGNDYITVSQDSNGKPLTKKALSELNKNRVKCRVEICFEDGSPVLPSDGQQCCMSNTEHSFDGLNLKLGPFQFNICSYKYGYKKFRLNVILSSRVDSQQDDEEPKFQDVVTLQSPPFIIKSKKPIARPGAKKALLQQQLSDSEQTATPVVHSPTENSQSDSSGKQQAKTKKGSKRSRESFQALVKATHSPQTLMQHAPTATSPLNSPRSNSQNSSGTVSPSTMAHYPTNNNGFFSNTFEQEQMVTPQDMEEQKRAFEHHLLSLLLNSINTPAQDIPPNMLIGNGLSFGNYQHVPLNLDRKSVV